MDDLEALKKKLETIVGIVNKFTSEAVQLRVVDALLAELLKGLDQSAAENVSRSKLKGQIEAPKQKQEW